MRSLAVLLAAAVTAAPVPTPLAYDQAQGLPTLLGLTLWNCAESRPNSLIADGLLEGHPALLPVVRAHEAKHRQQMLGRGCQLANEMMRDNAVSAQDEAEAFCEGARAGVRSHYYANLDDGIRHGAFNLAYGYRYGLTYEAAYAKIRTACGLTSERT